YFIVFASPGLAVRLKVKLIIWRKCGYMIFFRLNQIKMITDTSSIRAKVRKYPQCHSSSGIFSKFMPYIPAINVNGRKKAEKIVSNFITSLFFWALTEWYELSRLLASSRTSS